MAKPKKQLLTWYVQLENGDYEMHYVIAKSIHEAQRLYDEIASRDDTVLIEQEDY